jgi:phosphoenolpyruvate synthase/pyruvate phosphate dikinase
LDTVANEGINCDLRILIPGVSCDQEVDFLAEIIRGAAKTVRQTTNGSTSFSIGAELETPRSVIRSGSIGKVEGIHFASIDCDGLTRLVYGYDEHDASNFMDKYLDKEISTSNPFKQLDQKAVGWLISSAVIAMRANNSSYKVISLSKM